MSFNSEQTNSKANTDFDALVASVSGPASSELDDGRQWSPPVSAIGSHSWGNEVFQRSSTSKHSLFSKLPELASLPAVTSPKLETFGTGQYENRWLLLVTTGNKRKDAAQSLLEIWKSIEDFRDLNCLVFVLSTDNWDNLVRFRCRKVLEGGLGGRLDINLLSMQRTEKNMLDLDALGVINHEWEAPNGWNFCYPAYLLYCPDKTLVEKVILRDGGGVSYTVKADLATEFERSVLEWPMIEENVDRILLLIKKLSPLYSLAKGCGMTFEGFVKSLDSTADNVENPRLRALLKEVFEEVSKDE